MIAEQEIRGGVRKLEIEPHSGSANCGFGCNGKLEDIGKGRFPANTILTYDQITFDEVCGGFPYTKPAGNQIGKDINKNLDYEATSYKLSNNKCPKIPGDTGGSACRYFYCAKASKKDRDEGLDTFSQEKVNDGRQTPIDNPFQRGETPRKNTHPTVKPTELMQYLIRLVTPKGGTVLDPFMRKWKHRQSSSL